MADGLLPGGSTVIWPYYCGNLFPCHSQPADGTTFTLALDGVPRGQDRRVPAAMIAEAPPYMLAWAVGAYTQRDARHDDRGHARLAYWLPGRRDRGARRAPQNLVDGVRLVRDDTRPVRVRQRRRAASRSCGARALYGGMEHHPYWHVAKDAMGDEETHVHEAAHGWFGDGVRIAVLGGLRALRGHGQLSRGARAREGRAARDRGDASGPSITASSTTRSPRAARRRGRRAATRSTSSRTSCSRTCRTCEGAFFYKDVAAQVGADVLDGVIGDFYVAHKNEPARHAGHDRRDQADTGFDPTPIAQARLRKKF